MSRATAIHGRVLAAVLLLASALPLAGCGKKPGIVEAPAGVDATAFPRGYPPPEPLPPEGRVEGVGR